MKIKPDNVLKAFQSPYVIVKNGTLKTLKLTGTLISRENILKACHNPGKLFALFPLLKNSSVVFKRKSVVDVSIYNYS